jgi:hypothetical protein
MNVSHNLIIDAENNLGINMFRNLAYEKKMDGSTSYKFKREGYYEHVHDQYKYFVMHTMKELLRVSGEKIFKAISYA